MKYACQYAIVQFLPFVETGEFANVGMVLTCPELGHLDYEITSKGWGRISEFFSPLERRVYKTAIDRLTDELDRVASLAKRAKGVGQLEALWSELTRRRDGIIRYAPTRAVMTDDPAQVLADLFGRYVEHDFVTPEYQDRRLEQTVRAVLADADLARQFKKFPLGAHYFRIPLPFVQTDGDRPIKVIKPLFLAQDEPTKILIHGGEWLERFRRLRKHNYLPTDVKVLIPVARPGTNDLREEAFREICGDLSSADIQVTQIEDKAQIRAFAQGNSAAR